MSECNEMIILKNQIKTKEVKSYSYNYATKKMDVTFTSGKTFSYLPQNVQILKNPIKIKTEYYQFYKEGALLKNISEAYVFSAPYDEYYHLFFKNGYDREYSWDEITCKETALVNEISRDIYHYFKELSSISIIPNRDELGLDVNFLGKQYEKLVVSEDSALSVYWHYRENESSTKPLSPIFPFGCNLSQYKAVRNSLDSQLSVIEGPPGTGKTQTILNIIANVIIQGKNIQIVSNNNAAVENVLEKLEKYGLGFIVAKLGRVSNKEEFIENQSQFYPDFSNWFYTGDIKALSREIIDSSEKMQKVYTLKEQVARLQQDLDAIKLEKRYFDEYLSETDVSVSEISFRDSVSSQDILTLWNRLNKKAKSKDSFSIFEKIYMFFKYGIRKFNNFYNISIFISSLQNEFYLRKQKEIVESISNKNHEILLLNANEEKLINNSMIYLKDFLAKKYSKNKIRPKFVSESLWKSGQSVIDEYPVILSTTYSACNSLIQDGQSIMYDYLVMDEASQVDIVTGALALNARNAVIVGDLKQLPNVVTDEDAKKANFIFNEYSLDDGYYYLYSFLESLIKEVPGIPRVLLKEHYRCHPKIINFCNQKYYNGELAIMTVDKGEENVVTAIKTVEGYHKRGNSNLRQAEVIRDEILPKLGDNLSNIGIIAPYNAQVDLIKSMIPDVEVATVHKYQGREKDTIIISTSDDEVTDFSDNPNLVNVAVSRAKKKLYVVCSSNEQPNGSIKDLLSYIAYNNMDIQESKIYSIFDILYKQYTEELLRFEKKNEKVSEYMSENLMYSLIKEVLVELNINEFDVLIHFPMNMLIKDVSLLTEEEIRYAMHPNTHFDFIIYNKISKQIVLVIEVDGFQFHKEGTKQAERDKMKNTILDKYNIPYIRFSTNGSNEKEKLKNKLNDLYNKI